MNSAIPLFRALALAGLIVGTLTAQTRSNIDPDELYRRREDLSSAARAADLWAQRSGIDVEAAWKLLREPATGSARIKRSRAGEARSSAA